MNNVDFTKPLLSYENQIELIETIQRKDKKSEQALAQLIEYNICFVYSVSKQYIDQGLSDEQLIKAGTEGLTTAAGKYKGHYRKFKFITFAILWIRQEVKEALKAKEYNTTK